MKELVKPKKVVDEDAKVEGLLECSICYDYNVGSKYCPNYSSTEDQDDILF